MEVKADGTVIAQDGHTIAPKDYAASGISSVERVTVNGVSMWKLTASIANVGGLDVTKSTPAEINERLSNISNPVYCIYSNPIG